MKKEEFNLSEIIEKRKFCIYCRASPEYCKCSNKINYAIWEKIIKEDVKEFIKKLKEEINSNWLGKNKQYVGRVFVLTWIDKLAGKELI